MNRRPARAFSTGPVTPDEVTEMISLPQVLAPGVSARRSRCLICGSMIGGRECRTVTAIDWKGAGCDCGSLPAVTFLICAEHEIGGQVNTAQLALDAWHRRHGKQSA